MASFFIARFCLFVCLLLNIHRSGVFTALAWLVPHETAAVLAQVLCTPYNHAPCRFLQSHIRKVHACLAVTCHLHFWQNDLDLSRATAVTRGWNGYRNKSQHRNVLLTISCCVVSTKAACTQIYGRKFRALSEASIWCYIISNQGEAVFRYLTSSLLLLAL